MMHESDSGSRLSGPWQSRPVNRLANEEPEPTPEGDVLDRVVRLALEEDLGTGDLTSSLTIEPNSSDEGILIARESGVLAGMPVVERVFLHLEPKVVVTPMVDEGAGFRQGEILAAVAGPTKGILAGERVALNLLQHLCGVARSTSHYVSEVEGTGATILDTRKTTPGLRDLEKYAVRMGGGINHRFGLYDGILIKENHIHSAGGISEALDRIRKGLKAEGARFVVVVEVATRAQAREALEAGADRLLLDNMSATAMADVVEMVRQSEWSDIQLEASGGITLRNVREVAETGVDLISVGALTHSVDAVDISLILR